MDQAPLRVLAVQTTPGISSEVNVLRILLDASMRAPSGPARIEVLLMQGVEGSGAGGRSAADAFVGLSGVQVHEVQMGGLGREGFGVMRRAAKVVDLARMRLARRGLLRAARQFRPDVVYSAQQRWDQRLTTPIAARLGRPRVVHLHYTVGPWLGADAVESLRTADLLIGVSNYICDNAIAGGVAASRTQTLYNAATAEAPLPPSERARVRAQLRTELSMSGDAVVVGMVGRLSASKCQLELLRAMEPILRDSPDVHLVLAGTEYPTGNGLSERLRAAAAAAGVARQLHLLGHRGDVAALLDAFDVFAHPSREDPCPMAVLEAMAHGLPVVAWREGGPAEQVADRETGLLVPPMDVGALTEALMALVRDEPMRTTMGDAARARVETTFRPDVAAARFAELLSGVAARV